MSNTGKARLADAEILCFARPDEIAEWAAIKAWKDHVIRERWRVRQRENALRMRLRYRAERDVINAKRRKAFAERKAPGNGAAPAI